jgi:hypothetical protein
MLARLNARLTYANVVATLALFLALGGSAYAVSQITSKQVKNRSLKGIDLRKDTLTGNEIKENKLGVVPRASSADGAFQAITAANAANANLAALATNAQALDGHPAEFFEKNSRTQFGRADQFPATAADERVLLDYPGISMRVETVVGNNGCSGSQIGLRFRSTDASASPFRMIAPGSPQSGVLSAPGISVLACSGVNNAFQGVFGEEDGSAGISATGRTRFFRCFSFNDVRCIGERSEP